MSIFDCHFTRTETDSSYTCQPKQDKLISYIRSDTMSCRSQQDKKKQQQNNSIVIGTKVQNKVSIQPPLSNVSKSSRWALSMCMESLLNQLHKKRDYFVVASLKVKICQHKWNIRAARVKSSSRNAPALTISFLCRQSSSRQATFGSFSSSSALGTFVFHHGGESGFVPLCCGEIKACL